MKRSTKIDQRQNADPKFKKNRIFKKKKMHNKKKTAEAIGKLVTGDSKLVKKLTKRVKFLQTSEKKEVSCTPSKSSESSEGKKFDKKRKSTALPTTQGQPDRKKMLISLKKKDRKLLRKKEANPAVFERSSKLKKIWEDLRKEECKPEEQKQLLKQAINLMKGHVKELTYAHDTVRVLECVFGLATKDDQTLLFDEVKDAIIPLAKSHYAKFFLLKVLRSGYAEQKKLIVEKFEGNVLELIRHKEAAAVIEVAFNEVANASMRARLVQEFYGAQFKYFKDLECHSLDQLLKVKPELKSTVIPYMKDIILRVAEKSVIGHSIVHLVLSEFMKHANTASRTEVIEAIQALVVEILHTKDGARAAMHCLWHGTAKDRKAIIKSFRTHVVKIAKEEHGHRVLLALFDCVDDTKLVKKHIISELISSSSDTNNILEIFQDTYGKKVLLYLLCPRTPLHFDPCVIDILKEGDNNETSKKNMNIRQEELKQCIVAPLLKMIADSIKTSYVDNSFCFGVVTILQHTMGDNREAFKAIAEVSSESYAPDKVHIIESSGSHFMLKKLITQPQEANHVTFSEVLIETVEQNNFETWILCNRGCFLLSSLLETKIDSVVQRIKDSIDGLQKRLSKMTFKGAEILLKKLKQ